jgi:hypothetical protein
MNLLTSQNENSFFTISLVFVRPLYQDVVVGDEEYIYAGFKGGTPQVRVSAGTVGVGGVHMQVDGQFVHESPFLRILSTGFLFDGLPE